MPEAPLTPSFLHLLSPKWQGIRARAMKKQDGAVGRAILLAIIAVIFWGFIFGVLFRLLRYFKGVPEIGPLLAGKLLGLVLVLQDQAIRLHRYASVRRAPIPVTSLDGEPATATFD